MLPDLTALSLDALARDPARARDLPRDERLRLIQQAGGLLEALRAADIQATLAPASEATTDEPDRMLTTTEAATMLRRSVKWLYRRNGSLPFARRLSDRSWVYSEQGLRKWLARQRA